MTNPQGINLQLELPPIFNSCALRGSRLRPRLEMLLPFVRFAFILEGCLGFTVPELPP